MKTKKLLILLALTFVVILFGFATTKVNAVTVIDEIEITGVTEPVIGQAPTTDGIALFR